MSFFVISLVLSSVIKDVIRSGYEHCSTITDKSVTGREKEKTKVNLHNGLDGD